MENIKENLKEFEKAKWHTTNHIVFNTKEGPFRAVSINYYDKKIQGYKLFPGYGEFNPCRTFNIADVRIETI